MEKFRDGDYTAELRRMRLPDGYTENNSQVRGIEVLAAIASEDCGYMVMHCRLTARQWQSNWVYSTDSAFFGVSLASPGSVYKLTSRISCSVAHGVSVREYEAAISDAPGEVQIVDIRRDYLTNRIQNFTYPRAHHPNVTAFCFSATALSSTHVAGKGGAIFREYNAVLWDRATGQCIREFRDGSLFLKICDSYVAWEEYVAEREAFWCVVYDGVNPVAPGVQVCERGDRKTELRFIGDTLFRFLYNESSSSTYLSIALYHVLTGDKIGEVTLSEPLTYSDLGQARLVGETLIIPDSRGALTNIRCVDLRTGEVRRVHLGLCERLEDAHFSADGKRIVVYRPNNDLSVLSSFVIYNL